MAKGSGILDYLVGLIGRPKSHAEVHEVRRFLEWAPSEVSIKMVEDVKSSSGDLYVVRNSGLA